MSLFHRSVLAVLFLCSGLMAFYLLRSELPDALGAKVARLRWHYLMPIITATLFSRLAFFPKCSLTIIEENFLRIGWGEDRPSYGGYLPTYILGDWIGVDGLTAAIAMLAFEAVNITGMILVWWMIRHRASIRSWWRASTNGRVGTMKRAWL
jgi:hypothetical protein